MDNPDYLKFILALVYDTRKKKLSWTREEKKYVPFNSGFLKRADDIPYLHGAQFSAKLFSDSVKLLHVCNCHVSDDKEAFGYELYLEQDSKSISLCAGYEGEEYYKVLKELYDEVDQTFVEEGLPKGEQQMIERYVKRLGLEE